MAKVEIPTTRILWNMITYRNLFASETWRKELPYRTPEITEEADLSDVVALAYVTSLGQDSNLSGKDESEASRSVTNTSTRNATKSSSNCDQGSPVLHSNNVVINER